jgi:uncharacterized protein (TIGR03435 family)
MRASKSNQTEPVSIRREGAQLFLKGEQVTIESLVDFLSGDLQQPIQDETGLDGVYKIALHFTPVEANGNDIVAGAAEVPGSSLFTAVEEQLGLKLQPRKIPVRVVVIDHAEKPDVN